MEVLVKCENGFRFSATCKGYTVTTGRGENGNQERDGMWAAQTALFTWRATRDD
jgi:hypothetical protein